MARLVWLLALGLLLPGCDRAAEQAGRAKPDAPPGQSKLKVKEIETEALTLDGGSPGILHQEEVNGQVQRTPLETLLQAVPWSDWPMFLKNKRMPPRVLQATIEGMTITLPGPAEADRILIALPDTTDVTYTLALPRPPPAGSAPVAVAEAVVLQVQRQARDPHGVAIRWQEGYQAAAGLQLPAWLVPLGYYRLEWSGTEWVLMAQPGQ